MSEEKVELKEKEQEYVTGGLKYYRKIFIDESKCVSCSACARQCSYNAIDMSSGKAQVTASCNCCGACVDACPAEAVIGSY